MLTPTTIRLTSAAADLSPARGASTALMRVDFSSRGYWQASVRSGRLSGRSEMDFVLSASALAGLLSQVGELFCGKVSNRSYSASGKAKVANRDRSRDVGRSRDPVQPVP
jgi:hypothetical protein